MLELMLNIHLMPVIQIASYPVNDSYAVNSKYQLMLNILLMLEFLMALFLVLHFSCYTLMTSW